MADDAAASAAPMAAEAAPVAAMAEASAAEAAAMAGAGAAAGATAVSSFLLQAARATAATRDANRSDFFIFVLNSKDRTITGNCGTPPIHRAPTLTGQESSSISGA